MSVQRLNATVDAPETWKPPPAAVAVPLPAKITLVKATEEPALTMNALVFNSAVTVKPFPCTVRPVTPLIVIVPVSVKDAARLT